MRHVRSLQGVHISDVWLTIGSFDGIHRGHQEILHQLAAGAHTAGASAAVLTFHPHPAIVLGKRSSAQYLTTPEERADLLAGLGVDLLVTHPFNLEVASLSAGDFLHYLKGHLDFSHLWVGHDFAMGHNRGGNVVTLRRLGDEQGYQLHVVSPVRIEGQVVSSSRIRALLTDGDVTGAARLLGRPYRVNGRVVMGQRRGRQIGIPTANLAVDPDRALPARGVYVCKVQDETGAWDAVTNIGLRPTFQDQLSQPLVEAHLLNFEGDLYDHNLQLEFLHHLRAEQRFPGPEALVAQIQADIDRAREILARTP